MTLRVSLSRAARIVVAGMLLATAISATAVAKNPSNNLSGTASAVPGTVSAAALVRYNYSVTNTSSSNFSSFFVDAVTPNTDKDAALVALISVGNTTSGTTPTCTTSVDLHCTFGPLNSGKTATISVVYRTPTDASGSWTVVFAASSNGAPGSDPGNSHGDSYNVNATVNIGTGKAGGSYIFGTNLTAQNDQSLNKKNPQSSKLVFDTAGTNGGFPATLDEAAGSSTTYICPTAVSTACFGDWNLISANDGGPVPGGSFRVTYGYDKISGNQGNVGFVHLLDPDHDGVYGEGQVEGTDYVLIPSYNSDPCSTTKTTNCIESISTSGGDYFFTLILDGNGPMRGI